jgi:hypothetical protein
MVTHFPNFIDFEASSLSDNSYPIEVAWNSTDGSVESYLISPESMPSWTDWDSAAEEVHGIPREELIRNGKSPKWLCEHMAKQCGGSVFVSDAPPFDSRWLSVLFSANDSAPPFQIHGFKSVGVFNVLENAVLGRYCREARESVKGQHRAAIDVEYLKALYAIAWSRAAV